MNSILNDIIVSDTKKELMTEIDSCLSFKERTVIKARYMLGMPFKTYEALSKELNVTKEGARRIEFNGLQKLFNHFRGCKYELLGILTEGNQYRDMSYKYAVATDLEHNKISCSFCGNIISKDELSRVYRNYCKKCEKWKKNMLAKVKTRKNKKVKQCWMTKKWMQEHEYE